MNFTLQRTVIRGGVRIDSASWPCYSGNTGMKEKKGVLQTSEIPVIEKKSAHAARLVGKHRDILRCY